MSTRAEDFNLRIQVQKEKEQVLLKKLAAHETRRKAYLRLKEETANVMSRNETDKNLLIDHYSLRELDEEDLEICCQQIERLSDAITSNEEKIMLYEQELVKIDGEIAETRGELMQIAKAIEALRKDELQATVDEIQELFRSGEVGDLLKDDKEQRISLWVKKEEVFKAWLSNTTEWSLLGIHFLPKNLSAEDSAEFAQQQQDYITAMGEDSKKVEQYEKGISTLDNNITILEAAFAQMKQAEIAAIRNEIDASIQRKKQVAANLADAEVTSVTSIMQSLSVESSINENEKKKQALVSSLVVHDKNIESKPLAPPESPAIAAKKPQRYGITNFSLSQRQQQVLQGNLEPQQLSVVSESKPAAKPFSVLTELWRAVRGGGRTLFSPARDLDVQEKQHTHLHLPKGLIQ